MLVIEPEINSKILISDTSKMDFYRYTCLYLYYVYIRASL